MDESRLINLEKQISDQGLLLQKVANALLGSFDSSSIGLIEESRSLKRQVDELKKELTKAQATIETQTTQISDLNSFKTDVKKIVALIAFVVPFGVELLKFVGELLWGYVSHK